MNTSSPSTSILRFSLAFYLGCFNDLKQKLPFLSLPYTPGNSPVQWKGFLGPASYGYSLHLMIKWKKNALVVELEHLSLEHGWAMIWVIQTYLIVVQTSLPPTEILLAFPTPVSPSWRHWGNSSIYLFVSALGMLNSNPKKHNWCSEQLIPVCMWRKGDFPHQQAVLRHQLDVWQVDSILTLSIQRKHQIPKLRVSVLKDIPPPPQLSCQLQA